MVATENIQVGELIVQCMPWSHFPSDENSELYWTEWRKSIFDKEMSEEDSEFFNSLYPRSAKTRNQKE